MLRQLKFNLFDHLKINIENKRKNKEIINFYRALHNQINKDEGLNNLIPTLIQRSHSVDKSLFRPSHFVSEQVRQVANQLMARSKSPSFFNKSGLVIKRRILGDYVDFEKHLLDDK